MCDPVIFPNITAEMFAEIVVNIEKRTGTQIGTQVRGTLHHSGCTLEWQYLAPLQQLNIRCTDKPFFVSCDTVNDKLNELFGAEF